MGVQRPDGRLVALGVVVAGARVGLAAGRAAMVPVRIVARAPVIGDPLRRVAIALASDGRVAWSRGRAELEILVEAVLAAPELERAVDRALAGHLTDAVARSIADHQVVERVVAQVLVAADVDRIIDSVLEHEKTEEALERALASPALERLVAQVMDSRFVDELTERLLVSPELDRVVSYVASSPQVLEAISQQTRGLTEEMVADVRRRTQSVDEVAERTVRGWLRRPRPSAS